MGLNWKYIWLIVENFNIAYKLSRTKNNCSVWSHPITNFQPLWLVASISESVFKKFQQLVCLESYLWLVPTPVLDVVTQRHLHQECLVTNVGRILLWRRKDRSVVRLSGTYLLSPMPNPAHTLPKACLWERVCSTYKQCF